MFIVLFVVFVLDRLAADAGAVGVILGVQAIGGVIGGLVIGGLAARVGLRAMVGWGFIAFGLISLPTGNLPAVTTAVPVYAALFVLVGIPGVATSTGIQTLVQTLPRRRTWAGCPRRSRRARARSRWSACWSRGRSRTASGAPDP